jgi:hypothetical protein
METDGVRGKIEKLRPLKQRIQFITRQGLERLAYYERETAVFNIVENYFNERSVNTLMDISEVLAREKLTPCNYRAIHAAHNWPANSSLPCSQEEKK